MVSSQILNVNIVSRTWFYSHFTVNGASYLQYFFCFSRSIFYIFLQFQDNFGSLIKQKSSKYDRVPVLTGKTGLLVALGTSESLYNRELPTRLCS